MGTTRQKLTITSDTPGEKLFLLGNEAIARGALEGGLEVAAAYPGTPSSEITAALAGIAKQLDIYVEWSVNEKVAFEVAYGAAICGVRALATMKQVGLNVAHEPLMMACYTGVDGGLVLVSSGDPSAWSSQNEQDNRYIAEQAYIPVLEPSSVQEAKDMTAYAFELSEKFRHPVMLRPVTRIDHARSDVVLGKMPQEHRKGYFTKDPHRLVNVPATERRNRPALVQRFAQIKEAVNTLPYNQLKLVDGAKLGFIACGISYSYTMEALEWLGLEGKVSMLKIGTPHPLPEKLVKELLNSVEEILVVEEIEPFVENHVKIIAQEADIRVKIHGKDLIPLIGELSQRKVAEAISKLTKAELPVDFSEIDWIEQEATSLLPLRPPVLCPGCPHRGSVYVMRRAAERAAKKMGKEIEPIFPGDITCATLSYLTPIAIPDIQICMGGSFGLANGITHAINDQPIVASMGDSTFFHSGIPPLINAVYNKVNITMVVLDNRATAMTGFQPHPGTGSTAMGERTIAIKPEEVAKGCGVEFAEVIDPFNLKESIDLLERAIEFEGPSVVVFRRTCAIIDQREKKQRGEKVVSYYVDQEKCNTKCNVCIQMMSCPAILVNDGKSMIDSSLCVGCGICAQICPYKAIMREGEND